MLKDRRFVENLHDALLNLHCTNPCALLPPPNTEKVHQVDIFKIPIQKKDIKWTFSKYLYRKRTSSGHFQNTFTEKGHQVDFSLNKAKNVTKH